MKLEKPTPKVKVRPLCEVWVRVCPKPVLAMQDQYEVVDRSGFRYQVTKVGAMAFAQEIAAAVKPSNWVRAVDPACDVYNHVCDGWQGSYRVRFIDRLDPVTKDVLDPRLQAHLGRAEAQHARVLRRCQERLAGAA